MVTRLPILGILLILGGCAFGNTYDFQSQNLNFKKAVSGTIAVGVHDRRSYILSGNKTPQWVGLQRDRFGIPFGVHTVSDKPLADEFSTAVSGAIKRSKVDVIQVPLPHSMSRKKALRILAGHGAEKILYISLSEWKSRTLVRAVISYNILAEIFDNQGNLLGTKKLKGRENLGGNLIYPMGHAQSALPIAFRRIFENLLNDSQVSQSLQCQPGACASGNFTKNSEQLVDKPSSRPR
jgi:hypothetical protein